MPYENRMSKPPFAFDFDALARMMPPGTTISVTMPTNTKDAASAASLPFPSLPASSPQPPSANSGEKAAGGHAAGVNAAGVKPPFMKAAGGKGPSASSPCTRGKDCERMFCTFDHQHGVDPTKAFLRSQARYGPVIFEYTDGCLQASYLCACSTRLNFKEKKDKTEFVCHGKCQMCHDRAQSSKPPKKEEFSINDVLALELDERCPFLRTKLQDLLLANGKSQQEVEAVLRTAPADTLELFQLVLNTAKPKRA